MQKIAFITILFFSVFSFSQDRIIGDPITFTKHWIIKAGVNAVDDSRQWKPFDFLNDESSSAFSNPLALGIEFRFANANSISLFGSLNKWKAYEGLIDGVLLTEDRSYSSVDLSYKFYFDHFFLNANWLDIYIEGGLGLYFISADGGPFTERESKLSQNLGFGSIIWFSKSVGLNLQIVNKFSREELYTGNHVQYFAGLTLKLMKKDFDQDGIKNKNDMCPSVYGIEKFNGCPDSDNDGIEDVKDSCPNEPGTGLNGCPDADNDGIPDTDDKCPDKAGMAENKGCPIPEPIIEPILEPELESKPIVPPSEEVLKTLNDYAQTILFDYSKSLFKQETYAVLQAITSILKDYPESNFIIEGHTDSLGSHITNNRLSTARANAVKDYLISNGIDPARLTAIGYGEKRPKFSNKTKGGRDQNRRVEVKLKK